MAPARTQPAPKLPQTGPLIPNGDFEQARDGWPIDWPHPDHAAYLAEGGNHFVRLTAAGPDHMVMLYRRIGLGPKAEAFKLSFRVRYAGVKPGKPNWHDARVIVNFKDAAGDTLPGGPAAPSFRGTSKGWQSRSLGLVVPPGSAYLEIMPTLFCAAAGTLDIDDLKLTAIPRQDAGFVNFTLSRHMPVAKDCRSAELRVKGNRLVSRADGHEVWLQGVAIASMEWSATGEHILQSLGVALDKWHANVVRLAVRSDFWFGRGPWQSDGGVQYRALVDKVVRRVERKGAWVVIDLHEFGAPRQRDADFWRDVATRYANHPGVLFGLFNEPHDISWKVWRDGGWVTAKPKSAGKAKPATAGKARAGVKAGTGVKVGGAAPPAKPVRPVKKYYSVGMQKLLDVARRAGARNVVTAGGLDWAYDLSGVLKGYALTDREGNGVIYESHVYPWKRHWQERFLDAAARYPVLIGEVGCQPKPMPFIPAAQQEKPATWAPDILGCIQKYRLNWTAWCFHPHSSPCLILNWSYAPTPYWGRLVKAALAGRHFEMKKLR